MTSLVVPRPIGWLSTWGSDGVANLAPFSYFAALSVSPMLVGVSIGHPTEGREIAGSLLRERRHRGFLDCDERDLGGRAPGRR